MAQPNHDTILANYVTLPHPSAFSGINNVMAHSNLNQKQVSKLLSYVDSYTLHREYQKPRVRNPFYIYYLRQQLQVDLVDISGLARFNEGYNYLVCCIDCFSRYLWVRPTKRKEGTEVLGALRDIIDGMTQKPETLFCDRGTELKNQHLKRYLHQQNIRLLHPNSEGKAAIVERVNRSLQNLIYQYMTENESRTYIDALPMIVETYNRRPHRSIGKLSPNEAELPENAERVVGALRQHYTDCQRPKFKIKYKVGDLVRYKTNYGNVFARGYEEQFSRELCYIDSISRRMAIPTFKLRSANTGEVFQGSFYQEELQLRSSDEFKIERVLRRRIREGVPYALVKWLGFGPEHNSWIPESDVTRNFHNQRADVTSGSETERSGDSQSSSDTPRGRRT
jgi:Chromo (CHRromatin Organisation MOdifier) domain